MFWAFGDFRVRGVFWSFGGFGVEGCLRFGV